jgi:hypothetical protein
VGLIRDIPTVKGLIDRMVGEALESRDRLNKAAPQAAKSTA